MVSVLDRKLLRDLRGHAGVLLAIAGIIAVGVATFVTMRSAYRNLGEAKDLYYARCRMADFSIELKKAPLVEIERLNDFPGVTEIRPRIQFRVTVDLEGNPRIVNGLAVSLPERPRPIINDIVLKRGGYFTERQDEEVIVNDAFAQKHHLNPGDRLHLILNDRRQEFLVVGTAISSEFVYLLGPGSLVPDPENFGVFYLKHRYMEDTFDLQGACNQVIGRLSPEIREKPDELLRRAELLFEPYGVFSTTPRREQVSNQFLTDEIEQLGQFTFVMPTIFLAVAALILNVLMGRLTEQQRTIIGTLKALGYSDRQIFFHLLKVGVLVGLMGGLIGSGLGYLMAGGLTNLYRQFFELPALENRFFPEIYVVGLLISLACAILGVANGARGVLRLEPAEAMRPKPPPQGGAILLERISWVWKRLGTGWHMVLRNVFRNLRRNVVSIFATAMAASLLVMGSVSNRAIDYLVEFQFTKMLRSDVDLTFRDARGYDAWLEARRLPGVDHAEPVFDVACTLRHGPFERRGGITGLLPDARLTVPRDLEGRPVPLPPTGLAMGRAMAERLHVGIGDVVIVEPTEGRRNPRPARVETIIDSYLGLMVYADLHYLSALMDEEFALTSVQLQTDPRPESMAALHAELKELPAIQAVSERVQVVENLVKTLVEANSSSTVILILFAGLIFFGTTLNASLIGLAERRREVATLLVLGYTRADVGRLFLRESLLINGFGTFLGLPMGYEMFRLVVTAYQTDLFRIPLVTPWGAFGRTLVIGLAFTLAAHVFVQRSIQKIDLQDQMKVRE